MSWASLLRTTDSGRALRAAPELRVGAPRGARQGEVRAQRGMTLIEIMIVVGLMGLLMATMVFGSGMFSGANRRAAATLVVAGVRKGMAHANTTGKPVRLAIDLEGGRLILEEASSSVALRGGDEEEEEEEAEADPSQALLADAEALAEQILSGAPSADPGFTPVDVLGTDGDGPGRALASGIEFVKMQTEHDPEPLRDGLAYLYFWPGGMTERAVVWIAKKGDDTGLTVQVSPLTGRAEIKRGFVDLPERLFDEDEPYSEREEP